MNSVRPKAKQELEVQRNKSVPPITLDSHSPRLTLCEPMYKLFRAPEKIKMKRASLHIRKKEPARNIKNFRTTTLFMEKATLVRVKTTR